MCICVYIYLYIFDYHNALISHHGCSYYYLGNHGIKGANYIFLTRFGICLLVTHSL